MDRGLFGADEISDADTVAIVVLTFKTYNKFKFLPSHQVNEVLSR